MSIETKFDDDRGLDRDSVGLYLDEIAKTPLLDAAQEVELAKTIEAGKLAEAILEPERHNRKLTEAETQHLQKLGELATADELEWLAEEGVRAKQAFINANLRLVVSIARKYGRSKMPILDLIQEGNTGLIRAVEKFDYAKGYKFSTYATWWVRQSITRGIADSGRMVRLPVHVVEDINQLSAVRRKLTRELGFEPDVEDIAVELGTPVEKVQDLIRWNQEHVSLDTPIGDDGEATLGDLIAEEPTPGPEAQTLDTVEHEELLTLVQMLEPREAEIIQLRYGLLTGKAEDLRTIGQRLGLSPERVRQLVQTSIRRLTMYANHPEKRPTQKKVIEKPEEGVFEEILPNNQGGNKLLSYEEFAMLDELLFRNGSFDPANWNLSDDEVLAAKVYARSHSVAEVSRRLHINAAAAKLTVESALNTLRPSLAEEAS